MKFTLATLILAVVVAASAAQPTEAGCGYKNVTFVNTSGRILYVYGQIDYEHYNIWYCDYLSYSRVLYPGQRVTYSVPINQVGWFKFTTSAGSCCAWNTWESFWIDPYYDPWNEVLYL